MLVKSILRGAFLMHKKTRIEGGEVAGYENIRGANSKRTPEERRELAKKAGQASGKARRRKADFRKTLNLLLTAEIDNEEWKPVLESLGVECTLESALLMAQIKEAMAGNTKAAYFVAQYAGQNAQTAADGLNNVQKASAITVSVPTFDLSAITSGAATLQTNLKTFKETAAALQQQLPEMQKKLDAIAAAKDSLPSDSISQLTASVTQLNQGMQGLNTGLGTLSGGLGQLNTSVQAQFPTAIQGITELNGGFMQLGSYNTSLLSGAEKLKGSSSTLAAGAGTLQSGTNQLASGLNTLGSQMSAGAAKLSANSNALREGASSLSEGAKKLADGMDQFDKEGTSKLKSTVEDEFGDVLDRLKALTSDDCTYNTFSGKDSKMDGSVKFVIETEAIE